MTDDELKEEAKKVFAQYWLMTRLAFGTKITDEMTDIAKIIFTAGYVEGYRSKEEEK